MWPSNPFVTSDVSEAQNCGKMGILRVREATLSSFRACRKLKTVVRTFWTSPSDSFVTVCVADVENWCLCGAGGGGGGGGVVVFWWCFGGVFVVCGGVVAFLWCGGVLVFLWWCFFGGVLGVFVVVFCGDVLWWCFGGVFVVVFLWWCIGGGVFVVVFCGGCGGVVVVFLWWCF